MTTQTWLSGLSHYDDAGFRAWGSELNAKLAAAGLVKAGDAGQIDWASVGRPGGNTDAGFEVWRMDDDLQAAAPVFFRFAYGTHWGGNNPRITVALGTGTDGAGNLNGIVSVPQWMTNDYTPDGGMHTSWCCVTRGFFGLFWKNPSGPRGSIIFNRSTDEDGIPDATGGSLYVGRPATVATNQSFRFAAPATAYTNRQNERGMAVVPGLVTSSAVSPDLQAYPIFGHWPRARPLVGLCTVIVTEFPPGTTFQAALVGSTPRTYVALDGGAGVADTEWRYDYKLAMLWE